jgi:hypothetical protein
MVLYRVSIHVPPKKINMSRDRVTKEGVLIRNRIRFLENVTTNEDQSILEFTKANI